MTSVDNLVTLPAHWAGTVLSVTAHPPGFSVVIRADSGFKGYKRLSANNRDFPEGTLVHVGDTVRFLPGKKSKPRSLPKAHDVSILQKKIRKTDKSTL
jgi:hypothetical protein